MCGFVVVALCCFMLVSHSGYVALSFDGAVWCYAGLWAKHKNVTQSLNRRHVGALAFIIHLFEDECYTVDTIFLCFKVFLDSR